MESGTAQPLLQAEDDVKFDVLNASSESLTAENAYEVSVALSEPPPAVQIDLEAVASPRRAAKQRRSRRIRIIILVCYLLLVLAVMMSPIREYFSFDKLTEHHDTLQGHAADHTVLFPLLYLGIFAIVIVTSIPAVMVLFIASGIFFSQPLCTILNVVGSTLGCMCFYLLSSLFTSNKSATSISKLKDRAGDISSKNSFVGAFMAMARRDFEYNSTYYLLFVRIMPGIPMFVANLMPVFFKVGFVTYLWTTIVGTIPSAFVFAQAGRGIYRIMSSEEELSYDTILNDDSKLALFLLGLLAVLPVVGKRLLLSRRTRDRLASATTSSSSSLLRRSSGSIDELLEDDDDDDDDESLAVRGAGSGALRSTMSARQQK